MNTKSITALAGAVMAVGLVAAPGAEAQTGTTQTNTTLPRTTVTHSNLQRNTIRSASQAQIPHTRTPLPPRQAIQRTPTVTPTHSTRPNLPVSNENKPKPPL